MGKFRVLVLCSNYYTELSADYLEGCIRILQQPSYAARFDYHIEMIEAGTYEIPFVIQHIHQTNAYDGYLPLSLLLKGQTDHYDFIFSHIKESFMQFAMQGIAVGNGVISAPTLELLTARVHSMERAHEAIRALDYLLALKQRYVSSTDL